MLKSGYERLKKPFGKAMAKARDDRGLSQVDLAKILGESQQLISKIETGERRVDVIEFMILIRAIGCPPEEILSKIKL